MKSIIKLLVISLVAVSVHAQTNVVTPIANTNTVALTTTNAPSGKSDYGTYEFTLGGGGITNPKTGDTQFGFDFSLSTNPLKNAPNVWFGIAQDVSFEPTFAGSTDLFVDYANHIYKDLWVNTGWSAGAVYDREAPLVYRTGPEVTFEYYVGENAFIYAGVNYDFVSRGDRGLRYSLGVGIAF